MDDLKIPVCALEMIIVRIVSGNKGDIRHRGKDKI
jgi:hypothetical protein